MFCNKLYGFPIGFPSGQKARTTTNNKCLASARARRHKNSANKNEVTPFSPGQKTINKYDNGDDDEPVKRKASSLMLVREFVCVNVNV